MKEYIFKNKNKIKTLKSDKKINKKITIKFSNTELENLKTLYNDKINKYSFLFWFLVIISLVIIVNYILFYFFDKKLLINFILLKPSIQSLPILIASLYNISVVGKRIEKYQIRLKNIF
jgi:hypothetical protein